MARTQCDHERVVKVTRLVTRVEVDDSIADPRRLSATASHEAVLSNGDQVLLLDDRGWSISGPAEIWATTTPDEIADTARVVVGPDEPFAGYSQEDMEASHWNALATVLRRQGINVEGPALRELPHDVVLGKQLLARLRASAG
mgnify:FL=1